MVSDALPSGHGPNRNGKPRGSQIPLLTRLKVRNLYLSMSLSHRDIATQTGLSEKSVGQVISADGLPAVKAERVKDLKKRSDARTDRALTEVEHALADSAEEIALSGLNKAREAVQRVDRDAARDFQSYTGGVRNLVGVAKLIRDADARESALSERSTVNVFVTRCDPRLPEPRNVTPAPVAIEISAGETPQPTAHAQ